jgi:hypothetical protein
VTPRESHDMFYIIAIALLAVVVMFAFWMFW